MGTIRTVIQPCAVASGLALRGGPALRFEPAAAAARMGAAVTAAAAAPFVAAALAIVAMGPQQGPHRRLVRVVASAAARPLYRDGRGARLSCGPPPGPAALSRLHSRSALSL